LRFAGSSRPSTLLVDDGEGEEEEYAKMFEDIWFHALQFLENYKYDVHNYGPDELYKFADDTGILARHRSVSYRSSPSPESNA